MAAKFKKGSRVQWRWIGRVITGKVEDVFLEPVVMTIKGKRIKRNGSPAKPAYLVRSEADNLALKLESELETYQKRESAWEDAD